MSRTGKAKKKKSISKAWKDSSEERKCPRWLERKKNKTRVCCYVWRCKVVELTVRCPLLHRRSIVLQESRVRVTFILSFLLSRLTVLWLFVFPYTFCWNTLQVSLFPTCDIESILLNGSLKRHMWPYYTIDKEDKRGEAMPLGQWF